MPKDIAYLFDASIGKYYYGNTKDPKKYFPASLNQKNY